MTTVAEYIAQQLAAWGVRHIYGVVGDTLLPLLDAIAKQPQLRFITTRHETAAGFMASAEAKLTGRLTACLATSGPGITSLLNGLADAAADRAPVIALTGQVETKKIGTDAKQYIDQQTLILPITNNTVLLTHPDAIGQILPAAMRRALGEGRVGHVSLPKDLLAKACNAPLAPNEPWLDQAPSSPVAEEITRQMATAQRPLILIGQGAQGAGNQIQALAERWGAGIIQSLGAKGSVPFAHPLVLGGLGDGGSTASHLALAQADLLLALGCNWWPTRYVPAGLPVIKVDRDPLKIGGRMAVCAGIGGDVATITPHLTANLPAGGRPAWRTRLADLKAAWLNQLEAETAPDGPPLRPQFVIKTLEEALPPDTLIALDTGDHTVWFNRIFGGERQQVLVSGTWRSLGFGVPAALAAKLADPERTVVALVGDGGLQSLLGELVTAAELALPVLIVVMNNGMMAIEHNRALAKGLSPLGTSPLNPDFARLAAACGLVAHQVRTAAELQAVLPAALASKGPVLVEVHISAPFAPTAQG